MLPASSLCPTNIMSSLENRYVMRIGWGSHIKVRPSGWHLGGEGSEPSRDCVSPSRIIELINWLGRHWCLNSRVKGNISLTTKESLGMSSFCTCASSIVLYARHKHQRSSKMLCGFSLWNKSGAVCLDDLWLIIHLWRISPRTPQVLSCEQQIIALSKVCNINKAYALEHMNVVFP
jgi:hypothetical protein